MPAVQVPDWELLRRLDELFRPYGPPEGPCFTAEDTRGAYTADGVDELQREVERQEQAPDEISVYVNEGGKPGPRYDLGVTAARHRSPSPALFVSTDEAIVDHFAKRTQELFSAATERAGGNTMGGQERTALSPFPSARTPPVVETKSVRDFVVDHTVALVVTVVGTVAGGAILYLLFGS